jgi:hypothetical protein
MLPNAPLCDAGRCAQLVEALAAAKARMVASQSEQLVVILTAVFADPELGLSEAQRGLVPGLLARHAGLDLRTVEGSAV